MSNYFLPTAILLSIFIYVDLLSMEEHDTPYSDVITKAAKRQRIEEQDKEFYDRIQKIKSDCCHKVVTSDDVGKMKITFRNKEKPPETGLFYCGGRRYISVIKVLGWSVVHLHFGACPIENLKDCKKIDDLRGNVLNDITTYNNNHPDQMRLVYSYADSKKIDKKIRKVLMEDKNKVFRLAFLERLEERANQLKDHYKRPHKRCYEKQIHYTRQGIIHSGFSDCAHWKTKKKRWSLPRKGECVSDTDIFEWKRGRFHEEIEMCEECESGIKAMFEENDSFSFIAMERIKKKIERLEKRIAEEKNRILEQVK